MGAIGDGERALAVATAARLVREQGLSANKAAARAAGALTVTVSARTVLRWAAAAGTPLGALSQDRAKTAPARAALAGYTTARRVALCDRLLAAVEWRLADLEGNCPAAGELQRLALAFAVASDKRGQLERDAAAEAAYGDLDYWKWKTEHPVSFSAQSGPQLDAEDYHRLRPVAEAYQRWDAERRPAGWDDEDFDEDEDGDDGEADDG